MRKNIRSTDEDIQISLVHPIYKSYSRRTYDDSGNPILEERDKLIKEISVKRWIRKEDIISVDEYVTTKHKISNCRSVIFDRFSNRYFATFHNPEDLWTSIKQKNMAISQNKIGFK